LAQLAARMLSMHKVAGSIPAISTNKIAGSVPAFFFPVIMEMVTAAIVVLFPPHVDAFLSFPSLY
jgi:hypothetical protein